HRADVRELHVSGVAGERPEPVLERPDVAGPAEDGLDLPQRQVPAAREQGEQCAVLGVESRVPPPPAAGLLFSSLSRLSFPDLLFGLFWSRVPLDDCLSVLPPSPSVENSLECPDHPLPRFFWLGAGGRGATGGRSAVSKKGGEGRGGVPRIVGRSLPGFL